MSAEISMHTLSNPSESLIPKVREPMTSTTSKTGQVVGTTIGMLAMHSTISKTGQADGTAIVTFAGIAALAVIGLLVMRFGYLDLHLSEREGGLMMIGLIFIWACMTIKLAK